MRSDLHQNRASSPSVPPEYIQSTANRSGAPTREDGTTETPPWIEKKSGFSTPREVSTPRDVSTPRASASRREDFSSFFAPSTPAKYHGDSSPPRLLGSASTPCHEHRNKDVCLTRYEQDFEETKLLAKGRSVSLHEHAFNLKPKSMPLLSPVLVL